MDEFWSGSAYGVHAPLTDEAVREAERALGVALPATLVELLRVQNGGGVVFGRTAYPTSTRTSWAPDQVPFEDLMGIGPAGSVRTILDTPHLVREWDLPEPIVLLTGDGHWWIALDYRVCGPTGEPSVAWLDVDMREDLTLAPDFRSFIEGLVPTAAFAEDVG
ncbi:MAG TPA: SMI1/KNR4 family protein [Actinokineospora sp.]|nr:SMI1/KNR4 family protein [Actinokineospora sp.]